MRFCFRLQKQKIKNENESRKKQLKIIKNSKKSQKEIRILSNLTVCEYFPSIKTLWLQGLKKNMKDRSKSIEMLRINIIKKISGRSQICKPKRRFLEILYLIQKMRHGILSLLKILPSMNSAFSARLQNE